MPALRWFGREWRTGADDFSFSSVLYVLMLAASAAVCLAPLRVSGGRATYPQCPGTRAALVNTYLALGAVDCGAAAAFLVTAGASARGAVFEPRRRRAVPVLLYVDAALLLAAVALAGASLHFGIAGGSFRCPKGSHYVAMLRAASALSVAVAGLFALSLAVVFVPAGRHAPSSPDAYADRWWCRLRTLCCRCVRDKGDDEAFRDVAAVVALAFRGYDIVMSDIVAGMLLLHGYQERSRRVLMRRVRYPPPPDGVRETVSTQARPTPALTPAQREVVHDMYVYSRFYLAAYGCLLYQYMHCTTGVCRLCCFDPLMCLRARGGVRAVHEGSRCFCDVAALRRVTAVDEDDVLYSCWSNKLFRPVHYVAEDRRTDAVVVAVRGTMSLKDCVTDLAATPTRVALADTDAACAADDYYAHGGMYQSALYVVRTMETKGVFTHLARPENERKRVVVLGHSLGAGVAILVSIIVWSQHPELRPRLRCLAYSPPGGLLSTALAEYSRSFVWGCFVGNDIIPRLALHTVHRLREALFDVLAASRMPKSLIFLNAFRTGHIAKSLHPAATGSGGGGAARSPSNSAASVRSTPAEDDDGRVCSAESRAFREALRSRRCVPAGEETRRLVPCCRLIHFRKCVERHGGCCGGGTVEVFCPAVVGPEAVQMILSSPSMMSDHFPDRLLEVLRDADRRLQCGELDRFYGPPATDPVSLDTALGDEYPEATVQLGEHAVPGSANSADVGTVPGSAGGSSSPLLPQQQATRVAHHPDDSVISPSDLTMSPPEDPV